MLKRHHSLNRRRFLQALGGAACAGLPHLTLTGGAQAATAQGAGGGHILVLVELAGGNDGLNTVVPFRDPAYRGLRPTIGLGRRELISLDTDTGLHAAMPEVAGLWDAGALQIVEGVGYPNQNRSHFRSIEIWNAGLGADAFTQQGWISTGFESGGPTAEDADGLVLGGESGPLKGAGRFSALREEEIFRETVGNLPNAMHAKGHAVRDTRTTSPLEHVLATYDSARVTGDAILRKLEQSPARWLSFPGTELGMQLQTAARLLDAGVDVSVMKVVQEGYDTHEAQPDTHAWLLEELSQALGAFSEAMQKIGLWDQVVVMTYSEFGRTARENGSGGTDHGTAAPLFLAGGRVKGGLAGARSSLDRLHEGEMIHTTDYRAIYDAVLHDLWGVVPRFSQDERAALCVLRG